LDFVEPLTAYNEAKSLTLAKPRLRCAKQTEQLGFCSVQSRRRQYRRPGSPLNNHVGRPLSAGHDLKPCRDSGEQRQGCSEPLRLRNLNDWARPVDRRPGRFLCFQNIGEPDAIVLGRDCLEPTKITACAKSSCRIAARVAGALQWEQWAVVRLMWKELLRARDVSRRN
jgi:hypothetical protein